MKAKPWLAVGLIFCWVLFVVLAAELVLYPSFPQARLGWPTVAVHVSAYLLMAAPAALYAPRTLGALRMPWRQAVVGVALVLAALVYESVVLRVSAADLVQNTLRFVATGLGEEYLFRAFIWEQLSIAGLQTVPLIFANALLFTAFHVPEVVLSRASLAELAFVAALGVVFCVVRWGFLNAGLPALLHTAIDLAGI